jgi:hypothetical protein
MSTPSFLVGLPTGEAVYTSDYLQVILTDMDVFLSEPAETTTEMLRDWIDVMDTTLANRWSAALSFMPVTVGRNLREIQSLNRFLLSGMCTGCPC